MRGWQLCRGKQEKKCKGWKGWRVYKQEKLRVGKDLQERMRQSRNKDGGNRGDEWGDERQTVRAEEC